MRFLTTIFLFFSFCADAQVKNIDWYVKKSVETTPEVAVYRNRILSNRIDSQLIVAANRFQISGEGNGYYAPIINGYGYDEAITNGQQMSAIIAINKQVYNKRNLSLQFKAIRLAGDSLKANTAVNLLDLRKSIIAQYILAYSDQLQLEVNNDILQLLNREDTVLKILTQKNVYKQADYLSFLVTLQQQRLVRNQFAVQLKTDIGMLNYLSGIVDTSLVQLERPDLHEVEGALSTASPFITKFRIDSLRLENERNIVKAGYRPRVSLFADGGLQTTFSVFPYKNFGTSAGINLSIPIYDGHQKQMQLGKLGIEENTRQVQRDFFYRQYQQEVLQLRQQLSALDQLNGPVNEQIRYLETLIDVNSRLLETGDIGIADYVLALNNYISSRNLVVQNQVARWQLLNQLNYWHSDMNTLNF